MTGPWREAVLVAEASVATLGVAVSLAIAVVGAEFRWSLLVLVVSMAVAAGGLSKAWGWWSGRATRAREEVSEK